MKIQALVPRVNSKMMSRLQLVFFFSLLLVGGSRSMSFQGPNMEQLTLLMEQIGEIMIICRQNPSTCTCADGSTMDGNNLFHGLMRCRPSSCRCPDGLMVNDLDKIQVDEVLTMEMFRRVMSLGGYMGAWARVESHYEDFCDGSQPTQCICEDGSLVTDFEHNTSDLISCRTVACECSDGNTRDVPDNMRYSFLDHLDRICDLKECPCTNSSSALSSPFTSAAEYEECAPSTCICKDDSVKQMPAFPAMEVNLIEAFDEVSAKRMLNLATLCEGEAPEFCECARTDEPLTNFSDEEIVDNCYPKTCSCSGGSTKPAPDRRNSFTKVVRLMDLKHGKEESSKVTDFYSWNKYHSRHH
eukprot:TRINITY_DN445_c0_g1_i1.p1 TRINITY_DN445_c0_g1~~TRINITY_DN445_c0_g1_i1.p1  ORF type:complete len:356 (-),score=80.30 TRINITY_DN445_c0_g1_i1:118-1185(-)